MAEMFGSFAAANGVIVAPVVVMVLVGGIGGIVILCSLGTAARLFILVSRQYTFFGFVLLFMCEVVLSLCLLFILCVC